MKAFKEITFSKVLAMYFSIVFTVVLVLTLTSPEKLEILKIVATTTVSILLGYGAKSGYEFYSRSRYTQFNDGEMYYDE